MYDSYHDLRGSNTVPLNNRSIISKTASTEEIRVYDNFPSVLRLIIMTQLKGLLSHVDYQVTNKPTYYFKNTDKYALLAEINTKISDIKEDLYSKCGYNYIGKSM